MKENSDELRAANAPGGPRSASVPQPKETSFKAIGSSGRLGGSWQLRSLLRGVSFLMLSSYQRITSYICGISKSYSAQTNNSLLAEMMLFIQYFNMI